MLTYRNVLYANGNMGKSMVASLVELFALIYMTDVLGIAPHIAGSVVFVSLLWDGISDPLVGVLADKYRHRLKTIVPFLFIGVPITAFGLIVFFNLHHVSSASNILLILCLLIFRTGYTLVDIPHNSLFAFMANSPKESTYIASFRIFFSSVGKLVTTSTTGYLIARESSTTFADGMMLSSLILAILMIVSLGVCGSATRDIKLIESQTSQFSLQKLVKAFWRVKEIKALFVLTSINSLLFPSLGTFIVYSDSLQITDSNPATGVVYLSLFQLLSLLFWSSLANRFIGNEKATQLAYISFAVCGVTGLLLTLHQPFQLYTQAAFVGFCIGGISMLNWSLIPKALRVATKYHCDGCEISIMSLYTLLNKVTAGVSQMIFGYLLFLYGYIVNSDTNHIALDNAKTVLFCAVIILSCMSLILVNQFNKK